MTTSLVFPFFQKLRPVGRVGRVLLGAYLLACATLYLEQDKLILHPPAAPQGAADLGRPARPEDFSYLDRPPLSTTGHWRAWLPGRLSPWAAANRSTGPGLGQQERVYRP